MHGGCFVYQSICISLYSGLQENKSLDSPRNTDRVNWEILPPPSGVIAIVFSCGLKPWEHSDYCLRLYQPLAMIACKI